MNPDPFYLGIPPKSIFDKVDCREYPSLPLMYGFVEDKMGIKVRKNKYHEKYGDEHTHYINYLKQEEDGVVKTSYFTKIKTWGRVATSKGGMSLSVFHRPSRHSFCKNNYWDFDMVNCQPKILLDIALKAGKDVEGLAEYCSNSKQIRETLVSHYGLKDSVESGVFESAKDKAKKLFFRLAFGGSLKKWRSDHKIPNTIKDPKIIKDCETTFKELAFYIWNANPHLVADCNADEEFSKKSKDDKRKSVMARYCQTWERLCQEESIGFLVSNLPTAILADIVPSQDGMMPLKSQVSADKLEWLFENFEKVIFNRYGISVKWSLKEFDEAIPIRESFNPPISITLDDLELGEVHISKTISRIMKPNVKYDGRIKEWYVFGSKRQLWSISSTPPTGLFAETIQSYIMKLKNNLALSIVGADAKKTEELQEAISRVMKHYKKVGTGSYMNQCCKYMMEYLREDKWLDSLDNTVGKIVFADGIYDLKNGFKLGFCQSDRIITTLQHSWSKMRKADPVKMSKLRGEFLKILNNSKELLEYFLCMIGFCFTGESHLQKSLYYCVDGTTNSLGDNGKSLIFKILQSVFPEMVIFTDSTFLEDKNDTAHKQIAKFTKNFRIVFADEGSQRKLNEERLKKIAEGGELPYKKMFGGEEICKVVWKFICASNHTPKVKEEASYNRYVQIPFSSHFDRTGKRTTENAMALEFIADPKLLDTLLADYKEEIINLVIEYAVKFYKDGMPPLPDAVINATSATKKVNDAFHVWWNETFEESEGQRLSLDVIMSHSNDNRDNVIKEMKRIGIDFDKELKGLGKKVNKDGKEIYRKGGVVGWIVKEEDVTDDGADYIVPIATPI
jgi:phage/plasmid-associated DNA primase